MRSHPSIRQSTFSTPSLNLSRSYHHSIPNTHPADNKHKIQKARRTKRELSNAALLGVALGEHIGEGLVGAGQILLDGHVVFDLEEDDGRGAEQGDDEEDEIGDVLGLVRGVAGVDGPHHGGAAGLDALVETDVVGGAAAGVGERAHEPFCMSAWRWLLVGGIGEYTSRRLLAMRHHSHRRRCKGT